MEKERQRIELEKQRLLKEQKSRRQNIMEDVRQRLELEQLRILGRQREMEGERQLNPRSNDFEQHSSTEERTSFLTPKEDVNNISTESEDRSPATLHSKEVEPGMAGFDSGMDPEVVPPPQTLQPIIIDIGTRYIRIGYAGNESPSLVLPNLVGRMELERIGARAINFLQDRERNKLLMPDEIMRLTGNIYSKTLSLSKPINAGIISNEADFELLLEYLIFQRLQVMLEEHPVLFTFSMCMDRRMRRDLLSLFMINFGACAVCMVPHICCAISDPALVDTSPTRTGLVIDVGLDLSQCVAVYEGYAIETSVFVSQTAVGENLFRMATDVYPSLLSNEHEVREKCFDFLRRRICDVSPTGEDVTPIDTSPRAAGRRASEFEQRFEFPDGTSCHLSLRKRRQMGEIFFRPECHPTVAGLHELAFLALESLNDKELIVTMLSNVILIGDCADVKGLKQRMEHELRKNYPSIPIRVTCLPDAGVAAFRGASLLAASPEFEPRCITHVQYEYFGKEIADQMAI